MTEQELASAEAAMALGKTILTELRQLKAAAAVRATMDASYRTWNEGKELLPKELLLRVIAAGIATLIAKLEQEFAAIDLRVSVPEPDHPRCTCGAHGDPGSCGHHPSCPLKEIEG